VSDFPYDRDVDASHEIEHRTVSKADPELGARRCKSCRAPILWTVTESGKRMPLDFAPSADGTVAISVGEHEGRRAWRSRIAELGEAVVRRKSHFATCPNAATHRSSK
jgi:hypothetical protein